MENKAIALWSNFKEQFLKQKGGDQVCQSWLETVVPLKIEKRGPGFYLTLKIPSGLHKKWLEEHIMEDIHKYFHPFYEGSFHIRLEVAPRISFQNKISAVSKLPALKSSLFFNPDYVFETFVVGENSQLAYSASQAVTKNPQAGKDLNPLFIYGPSGLGKTHLLNAIGQQFLKNHPQSRILYLSAERFLNEYISALQQKQMDQFRKKFRKSCNLLLMDDIQIIAKGKGVQEEFFHTFNDLYSQRAQIVVCCDQSPGSIPFLEERIRTRLEGGLMTDIFYPDQETRMAILKNKTNQRKLFLSSQSLEQIAGACKGSVREMEGVLNKIKIMTELHDGSLSLSGVKQILNQIKKDLTVELIQKKTAQAFKISLEELKSPSRKKHIVTGRQAAMYLIRCLLKKSLNDISLAFGKKDHTTVLNSLKKVEKLKVKNKDFKRLLEDLQREIHNGYWINKKTC